LAGFNLKEKALMELSSQVRSESVFRKELLQSLPFEGIICGNL
jgi:hypothetical protein